ncbi:3'-5' exoribonuclease [Candidatus Pacearchaeota archaeon]|nr:3'-5' exoribonuclease [Candidatus Pacearchaeota archaeon]
MIKPIALDIETSGLDKVNCGIWQIGAVDLNTMEEFIEEARIDDDDSVEEDSLKVIGKSEKELRNKEKQSQEELLNKFFRWMESRKIRNVLCQNPQFDVALIEIKANKYGLKKTFQHRAFDLHSIAQTLYSIFNKKLLLRNGKDTDAMESNMNLTNILNFCGLPEERRITHSGEILKEGKPHNALEDAKLAAECFSRIIEGKSVFPEYFKFEVPEVLRK